MMRRSHRHAQGLSLIELLLGLAVVALVMAPLLPMLETAHASARISAERRDLERDAQFALARISARVRAATPSPTLASQLQGDWFDPYSYLVVNGKLVEREDDKESSDRILAESVTDFRLNAPAVDAGAPMVEISLTLARGDAATTVNAAVRMGSVQ
ncbi:prepilin-type N-terminal cleavage/methylation domain-containing protein [Massilia sp. H6]|uniref:prepilin-type N-terminal cleavage/methylation domain-containing protein n=1 Tax=Massilia sp. H6 TaxID=2970464 RepID=UPI00216996A9|nr:prepilin-type N-terminal cleavage/methylation domain-containing protein [Massilia sp. H6]UVW28730.1 prepilin-type N-terminal cleavage/methylation domain-containing protein [Massilia sp. H6]